MYTVEISGLEEQLKKLHGYAGIADRHLIDAMNRSVLTLEDAIKPLTPVFRGRLRNSIASEVKREGTMSVTGRVFSSINEVYPSVMEFGRTPGAAGPPSAALERWAQLVLGDARLAFVVARAIHSHPKPGRFFMQRGFEKSKGKIDGFFNRALELITQGLSVD